MRDRDTWRRRTTQLGTSGDDLARGFKDRGKSPEKCVFDVSREPLICGNWKDHKKENGKEADTATLLAVHLSRFQPGGEGTSRRGRVPTEKEQI